MWGKHMKQYSKTGIDKLSKPGMYRVDQTLYLNISRRGTKSWIQRIVINGKRHDMGIGPYPIVTVREAKERAFENRREVYQGGDPVAERRKACIPTFRDAAQKTLEATSARWRNAKTKANWIGGMERYALPVLGDMPVDRIGREHVLKVLTPIWTTKSEVARKLKQRIRAVFAWCQAHGHIDTNPAGEAIDAALPKMPKVRSNFRALPYRDVPDALRTIEESGASIAAKLALRFTILTAARSGEVRGGTWAEIDLEAGVWTIPANRMKANAEHRVPLSAEALRVLEQARVLEDGSGLVFPSPTRHGSPLSDMTMTKVLRDRGLAERATVHGFRSSFRDWCAESGQPREVAEAALAHTIGGVEGAYFRSDLFAKRRNLMDAWAQYLIGESARVVRLHA